MNTSSRGKISLAVLIVMFIFMIEYRFFYLIRFPDFFQKLFTYQNKTLLFLITIVLCILWGKGRVKLQLSKYIVSLLIWISISAIYCIIVYKPHLNEVLVPFTAYFSLLLYYPLVNIMRRDLGKLIVILTWFNIMACIILLMQFVVYKETGKLFLSVYEFYKTNMLTIRDGNVRIIYSSTIVSLSALISMGKIFDEEKRNKLFHWTNLLLSLLYFYLVSQTRMYVISLLIVFVLLFIRKNSKLQLSKIVSFIFGISIISIFFSLLGFFDYVFNLINPLLYGTYQNDGSYYARLDGIQYYLNVIKEKTVLGLGMFDPDRTSIFYNLVHGNTGKLFYTDIGILGSMAKLGAPVLIWYIFLLRKLGAIVLNVKENIVFSLYSFIVLTTITLVVLDPQRIFFLTFSMAIFEACLEKATGQCDSESSELIY
ncbi:hypothetical protein JZO73_05985 [Enterococcus plantarum]|uniref:O-antigen ligase family protein n=1 Tax=Enterococcus plantarum TaxID=1077675 RepID=UPI001A8E353F|nr:O-antigen ligase family protein [Enterococcus plantarum]MBO0467081.1 hypothetical protein [Enterococcus plantarum]